MGGQQELKQQTSISTKQKLEVAEKEQTPLLGGLVVVIVVCCVGVVFNKLLNNKTIMLL